MGDRAGQALGAPCQTGFSLPPPRATQIKTYSWDNAQVILVGNKCDLEDDRVIPTEEGKRLAEELGLSCPGGEGGSRLAPPTCTPPCPPPNGSFAFCGASPPVCVCVCSSSRV